MADAFRALLGHAREGGIRFRPLGQLLPADPATLPLGELRRGSLAGREGWLGVQR
jgi:undecaprenyl phosphate-alpha-L-ara4FN deformylase